MRQLIDQHQPVVADEHGNNSAIGEIAGPEHHRSFGAFETRQASFQFRIKRVIAGDEPRRPGADAVSLDRVGRRPFERRMLRQVQIIEAGERQQSLAAALDIDAVLAHGLADRPVQAAPFDLLELLVSIIVERLHHVTWNQQAGKMPAAIRLGKR